MEIKVPRILYATIISIATCPCSGFLIPSQIRRHTIKSYPRNVGLFIRKRSSSTISTEPLSFDDDDEINKEKKKPKVKHRGEKKEGNVMETWRIFGIQVHPDDLAQDESEIDNPKSSKKTNKTYLTPSVKKALLKKLKMPPASTAALHNIQVIRRSLDARKYRPRQATNDPLYTHVIDVQLSSRDARRFKFRHTPGKSERAERPSSDETDASPASSSTGAPPRVVVVGSGPAGLFCALHLKSLNFSPILLERGLAVEKRGRSIGALINRRILDSESNYAFGEGGAGTWSDGKLTTRIGRNSFWVRRVLEILVKYGASPEILVEGAPHLGTDNLVRILKNLRGDLGDVRFGAKVTKIVTEKGRVTGVQVEYSDDSEYTEKRTEFIEADAVVLATGHSARDVYQELAQNSDALLLPKGFAVGFRVEHPQALINSIQYGSEWAKMVTTGKGRTDKANLDFIQQQQDTSNIEDPTSHSGKLPAASYRLATDKARDGVDGGKRGAYSFCMCPGGQIVPSSTEPGELCVNGMSFSKRDSIWANSALVVNIPDPVNDPVLQPYREKYGTTMAGIEFQKDMERRAATMGGGNMVCPVQRITDFLEGTVSETIPSSSYRLGVKSAPCHEIYPKEITNALRDAIEHQFDQHQLKGFLSSEGLLHGVETRTSSPVRIARDDETLQAVGVKGLFPAGEGAGFAGGIVSAAVDGMVVGEAVLEEFGETLLTAGKQGKNKVVGFHY